MGTDPEMCRQVVAGVRAATRLPVVAKLTPNVTDIAAVARGARDGGADAVTVINTCQGMAVDWRRRRPLLGNVVGGLSGPAIKPIALRCVHQVRRAVEIPIIGVGGIMTIDDCMEFFVAGASAVQVGTANFAEPVASMRLLDELPAALGELGAGRLADIVGTLQLPQRPAACPPAGPPAGTTPAGNPV
jgi:dihydroorotate dehydrogenase (NAD+) catalytic subunit